MPRLAVRPHFCHGLVRNSPKIDCVADDAVECLFTVRSKRKQKQIATRTALHEMHESSHIFPSFF